MFRNTVKSIIRFRRSQKRGYKIGCNEDIKLLDSVIKYKDTKDYPEEDVDLFHGNIYFKKGEDVYSYEYNLLKTVTPYILTDMVLYHYDRVGCIIISGFVLYFHYNIGQCGYHDRKNSLKFFIEKQKLYEKK